MCRYADQYAGEVHVAACLAFLDEAARPFDREQLDGHFTGSAWLVSADGEKVLLTHHCKLKRWLQLGGHADGDSDLAAVALREAHEESGLMHLRVEPEIFDVDRHWIPERKSEPGHWHHDVRYVIWATVDDAFVVSDESLELAWVSIHQLVDVENESLRRMARKWMTRS
ncbi:NUDIX hydrolase [Dyella sp. M7H15-1]|uniref:NUDIX hydrolase n=1 Tax=Dyella sp. M7H15-1 TaxID=2501295 RepID=UPI001F0CB633|nr:NUDIX hydrolase [Dyella sp. M7H15-1]